MNETELGGRVFWTLIAIGVLSGVGSSWALRRWSDAKEIHAALNRTMAHLFELRLFSDEPALVLRAQRDLIAANGLFLRKMAGPSLVLVLPFALLLVGMEALFARAPLQTGKPAVITLEYRRVPGGALSDARLDAPPGIQVETPGVYVPGIRQVSWRVRPAIATSGKLRIHCQGRLLTKSVSAGQGLHWLSDRRDGSILAFLLHPLELPFSDSTAASVLVEYPRATIRNRSWAVWFSLAFVAGATSYFIGPGSRYIRRM